MENIVKQADLLTQTWNAFAKHKSNGFGVEYHLSVLFAHDPVGHPFEMLLGAVENYRTALSFQRSRSNHTTLTRFLAKAVDPLFPFWPENFVADFHDADAWDREGDIGKRLAEI